MQKVSGIILCGGKNSRMGKNKALLELGGKPVIMHLVETLKTLCSEIILSTNNNELDFLPYPKVVDHYKDIGPIAGFHSALGSSQTQDNLIVSCDTPFVSAKLLSYLLLRKKNYNLVLPSVARHLQPMIGYFKKEMVHTIEQQIKAGNRKPINIFENCKLLKIEISKALPFYNEYLFFNMNTEKDYQEARRIYQSISG